MKVVHKHHSKAQVMRLGRHVEALYVASGLSDTAFAAESSVVLGFDIRPRHIAETREAFSPAIPNNLVALAEKRKEERARPAPGMVQIELFNALVARVAALECAASIEKAARVQPRFNDNPFPNMVVDICASGSAL
jgi:hypothetical protein